MLLLKKHNGDFFSPAAAAPAVVADSCDWPADPFADPAVDQAGDIAPCPRCAPGHDGRRNFVWLDRFGGHHCPDCEFPPSLAMVDRIVFVGPERPGDERVMLDMTEKLFPILEQEFFRRLAERRQKNHDAAAHDDFLD